MYGPGKFTGGYEAGVQGLAQAMIIQNKSPAPLLPGRALRWWRVAGGPMHTPGAWIGDMYGPGKFTGGYEAGVQGLAQAMIIQNKSPAPLLPGRAPQWWRVAGGPMHTPGAWIGAHMYGCV